MENINQYGLSRTIDEETKRKIRENSGFGCVICGLGIYEYEHVDPEFKDAKIHDPSKMTLLCSQHHAKVTRKTLSKKTVKLAMQNPHALQKGFANETFDILPDEPLEVIFGSNRFVNVESLIVIKKEPILVIKPPETHGSPILISGKFYNSQDKLSLEIINNEWKAYATNWDVKTVGKILTIREAQSKIHLQIEVNPPHSISIKRINMTHSGYTLTGNEKEMTVVHSNNPQQNLITNKECVFSDLQIGMEF